MESISNIIERILGKTTGKRKPYEEHELIYDSSSETLEPIYFWIVDFMNNLFGGKVEKLIDNFSASPGGGFFSELSQKKSILQDNVSKNLGAVNQVIRVIVNLIYDLKDFEIRLKHYDESKSEDKERKEAGLLALKQIWMDNVDIKRGQGSINAMASGQLQFVTLRDAFLATSSLKDADKIDLNDRVKRILKPRLAEFIEWKKLSEQELRKRFSIEKNYLRSQVNTLQLYSRWIKPYLKSSSELEMKEHDKNPDMVTAFSTTVFELTIMGKNEIDVEKSVLSKDLPSGMKKSKRKYYSIVLIDFYFRGIPGKVSQNYVFGGRATVNFKSYALNDEELKVLEQELKKSEINDVMKLIEGSTTESLDELKKDIDYFIEDKDKRDLKTKKPVDNNPFSALFGGMFGSKKKQEKSSDNLQIELTRIKKDKYSESVIRKFAGEESAKLCFSIFDVYKKSHGMASHDSPFE